MANIEKMKAVVEAKAERVTESGCWIWTGRKKTKANWYSVTNVDGVTDGVHRFSYRAFKGEPGNLSVLHRCDVPCCVNPDHLFLGDAAANMADKKAKGRCSRKKTRAKMTEADVVKVRELAATGMTHREIAAMFGVSQSAVSMAVRRDTWA